MSSVENHSSSSAVRTRPQVRARLAALNRQMDGLLDLLQTACERKPKNKSFDRKGARHHLKFMALVYLEGEAGIEQRRMLAPPGDRAQVLHQLGAVLGDSRCKLDEVMQDDLRGRLFLSWCEGHGNPDLTDPVMGLFDAKFDRAVRDVFAGLLDLEKAAFRAAGQLCHGPGRPDGTCALPHDFIVGLESTYRAITGKPGGAGPGPFARFVKMFLEALGREAVQQTLIDAIKDARRREQKNGATSRWGRSLFADAGVKPLSAPAN